MKGKEHFQSSQPDLIVENGLNPGVTYFDGIGSSGWKETWEALSVVTDVSTSWADVIFRITLKSIPHDMLFYTRWVVSIFSGKNAILTDYSDP